MLHSSLSAVSSDTPPTVACPQCGERVPWTTDSPYRPFCSRRCRMIDLGDWLDERHQIPGDPASPEEDD
ncbi:DNA gyrase inhibitor YacG [Spiribacter vilamensis]|uniref:DNA gyrase inhibitor YacG n=1 Tax=Spiribacter vilamensis TaxID=531306 RepID=UPI00102AD692|nr:DNA gyrase inhibitor YacG [Spiribacter vilamensis]TVO61162.1 DNA gyrase inhibitor YacG [Spiribacter vilamensis]